MMPLKVTIDAQQVLKRQRDLQGRWASYRPVMRGPVRNLIEDFFERQFETEGQYGGHPWQELTATTLRIKAAQGFGGMGILRRKDKMYDALTGRSTEGIHYIFSKSGLRFEVSVPYAWRHQIGRIRGGTARVLLPTPMPEEFMTKLRNLVRGYMIRGELIQFGR